jgi:beta-galactosidase/beta-glucuronidase
MNMPTQGDGMSDLPRSEYPRPQFFREDWLCLNGEWQFEIDQGDSGIHRGLRDRELDSTIIVPFCPESKLSGIENHDYYNAVWYRRQVTIPADWTDRRVLLHFQAVDYDATVWVNGQEVGRHRGGFSPFHCDLDGVASAGDEITIVVRARDYGKTSQPRGKQSSDFGPEGANYVRTTGIWQTVWMEPVPDVYLKRPRLTPDVANSVIRLEQPITNDSNGLRLRATLSDENGDIVTAECSAEYDLSPRLDLAIPDDRVRLWSIDDPHLYDVEIALIDAGGNVVDTAKSYTGLRSVSIAGKAIKINNKVVFQRLVLDQGYYPDGIMTAPSDEALIEDIQLSIDAGFNGARLHQKVFEERFLYHADRMGYIVWGEFGDWGCSQNGPLTGERLTPGPDYITQWLECLERDYSHPSIVGWCPLNETWQTMTDYITVLDDVTHGMYYATKAMDSTRPVLDTSGYSHRVVGADVYDSHDYHQDPDEFRERHAGLAEGKPFLNDASQWGLSEDTVGNIQWSIPYNGQPFFVSEFGGIWWNPEVQEDEDSWGYGDPPKSIEEFYNRFERLCAVLLNDVNMFGYCYTQLTDILQEQNGIYKYDRSKKFDMERIKKAQIRPAAIELENNDTT